MWTSKKLCWAASKHESFACDAEPKSRRITMSEESYVGSLPGAWAWAISCMLDGKSKRCNARRKAEFRSLSELIRNPIIDLFRNISSDSSRYLSLLL